MAATIPSMKKLQQIPSAKINNRQDGYRSRYRRRNNSLSTFNTSPDKAANYHVRESPFHCNIKLEVLDVIEKSHPTITGSNQTLNHKIIHYSRPFLKNRRSSCNRENLRRRHPPLPDEERWGRPHLMVVVLRDIPQITTEIKKKLIIDWHAIRCNLNHKNVQENWGHQKL